MRDCHYDFHVYSREIEDTAQFGRLDPFEDPTHTCPQCGRSHFVYNLAGTFFCQRDGRPMGRLVPQPWGRVRRVWASAATPTPPPHP